MDPVAERSGESWNIYEDMAITGDLEVSACGLPPLADEDLGAVPYYPRQVIVDVLFLYTGLARADFGEDALQERIELSIAYMNEACNRSGISARFRKVHQAETTWHAETPLAADELSWLRTDQRVAEMRDRYGADIVTLIGSKVLPNGGLGEFPGNFSVYRGDPGTFAHECGHNLGCAHDRASLPSYLAASEGYAFGYSFVPPNSEFRYGDIMSYIGSQIEQFSNPEKCFMGGCTGAPINHLDAQGRPDAANAAFAIAHAVPYLAAVRSELVTILSSPFFDTVAREFSFQIQGPDFGECVVESSSDCRIWSPWTNCWLQGDIVALSDSVGEHKARFYRASIAGVLLPNQLGFAVKSVPPGFSMIANPLESLENSVTALLSDVPEGTQVFKWIEGEGRWVCNSFSLGEWNEPEMTMHPGEGVVLHNSNSASFTIAFVGEINRALRNRVPLQFSIRSSAIPQSGRITSDLGCRPFGEGGQLIRMSEKGAYSVFTWDGSEWSPFEPTIELGEAFWCRNPLNAFIWQRVLH